MNIVSNKPTITRKELVGVLDCLINGELVHGFTVKEFESIISGITKLRFSLATNSSTSAYHLAYKALEIGPGDEVVIQSYSDPAPLSALTLTGAVPCIVDINENKYTPSIEQIKEKINSKTKGIVVNHLFGFPADIKDLHELNIPVIEDVSHIIGADYEKFSASGVIQIASFSPESLITTGNGGIVLTNNSRQFSVMKDLRDAYPENLNLSFDYRLTDFQAAMGIFQSSRLNDFIKRRREIARLYYDSLKFTTHKTIFHYSDDFTFQTFPVIFDASPDKIEKYWKKNKIELVKPIAISLHKYLNLKSMDYPNSERLSNKLFALPIYPTLTKKEIERLTKAIAKFI